MLCGLNGSSNWSSTLSLGFALSASLTRNRSSWAQSPVSNSKVLSSNIVESVWVMTTFRSFGQTTDPRTSSLRVSGCPRSSDRSSEQSVSSSSSGRREGVIPGHGSSVASRRLAWTNVWWWNRITAIGLFEPHGLESPRASLNKAHYWARIVEQFV